MVECVDVGVRTVGVGVGWDVVVWEFVVRNPSGLCVLCEVMV